VIDCAELVHLVAVLSEDNSTGPDSGTITIPINTPVRWSYKAPNVVVDPVFTNPVCSTTILSGLNPADGQAVVAYTCDPSATGNPANHSYAITLHLAGRYLSTTAGPILVDGGAHQDSPTVKDLTATASDFPAPQPCPPPPDLRTTKTLTSGDGSPGATLLYTISTLNNSNTDAAGVTLTETVPNLTSFNPAGSSPGWSCSPDGSAGSTCTRSLGTLPALATDTTTFAVLVASSFPNSPAPIVNTACSATTTPGEDASNNCGSVSTPAGGSNPDLSLAKSVQSGNGDPGSTLVYRLQVSNLGARASLAFSIAETLPPNTAFAAASSSPGWACAGSNCTLSAPPLSGNATAVYAFAVTVANPLPPNPAPIANTACLTGLPPSDPNANNCGSVSTPPGGTPDVSLAKTLMSGTGAPGGVLVYNLALSNLGNRGAANAVLTETVPAATSWEPTASSPGWTCSSPAAGSACTLPIGSLPAGSTVNRLFAVRVVTPLPPGVTSLDNTACANDEFPSDPAANNCSTISTPPTGNPDLALTKTLTSGTLAPGALLTYTLSLTNSGNRAATAVALDEVVPASSTFDAAASSAGWSCTPDGSPGSHCSLPLGTVAANALITKTFAVSLANSLPPGLQVSNTACARQSPGDADPQGNNCSTIVSKPPAQLTDISLTLKADPAVKSLASPDPFTFTLTMSNASDVAATRLTATITLPPFGTSPSSLDPRCRPIAGNGLECSLDTLAPHSDVAFSWTQGALAAGSYTVVADLSAASPDDVDSTPGNDVPTEDDHAEATVEVIASSIQDIPTLGSFSLVGLAVLLAITALATLARSRRHPAPSLED